MIEIYDREQQLKNLAAAIGRLAGKDGRIIGASERLISLDIFAALGYDVTDTHGRMGLAYRWTNQSAAPPIRYHSGSSWCSATDLTDLGTAVRNLIPPGYKIAEMKDGQKTSGGEFCEVRLWIPDNYALGYLYRSTAATPGLAVCMAALRAYADGAEGWGDQ